MNGIQRLLRTRLAHFEADETPNTDPTRGQDGKHTTYTTLPLEEQLRESLQSTNSSIRIREYITKSEAGEPVEGIAKEVKQIDEDEKAQYYPFCSPTDFSFARWLLQIRATKSGVDDFF